MFKLINVPNPICRICDRSGIKVRKMTNDHKLMISNLFGLQVDDDRSFPFRVCKKCEKVLETSNNFRNLVSKAVERFEELHEKMKINKPKRIKLETGNVKVESASNEEQKINDEYIVKYKCPRCPTSFNTATEFFEHFDKSHKTSNNYVMDELENMCKSCMEIFDSAEELSKHKCDEEPENLIYDDCTDDTETEEPFSLPEFIPNNPENCLICNTSFFDKKDLADHLVSSHTSYLCNICLKEFSTKKQFNEHATIHTIGRKPSIQCKLCKRVYTATSRKIKDHFREFHWKIKK